MNEELERAVLAIRELQESIWRIESRLDRLEERIFEGGSASPAIRLQQRSIEDSEEARETPFPAQPSRINPVLIGRSLIAFGGAYLLRALTESGAFPLVIGAVAGLIYAAVFLFHAHRQAPFAPTSSAFHAVTAILIAMPLAVETSVWFRQMQAATAFLIVLLFLVAASTIALRHRLRALAWIVEVVTVGSLVVLTIGTRGFVLGLLALLFIAIGSLFAARRLSMPPLVFLPALLSCLAILPITDLAVTDRAPPGAVTGLLSILIFLGAWIVALMIDCRFDAERPGPGLTMLLTFVVVIGLGSGLYVARETGLTFMFAPVTAAIALATGVYAWRLTVSAGDEDRRSIVFVLVTSVLLMAMSGAIVGSEPGAIIWLVLASVSILLARSGHPLLFAPCIIFVVGAAVESGLVVWMTRALVQVPDASQLLPAASAVATVLALGGFLAATPRGSIRLAFLRSALDATTTTLLVAASASLVIRILQAMLPFFGFSVRDAGAVAAFRTIVLSLLAILLAWLSGWPRSRTISRLVNPILVLTAILIVLINVRIGRAATHFPAFSFYGIALIVAPALRRRSLARRRLNGRDRSPDPAGPDPAESPMVVPPAPLSEK